MAEIIRPGQAGTLESNDIMITVAPAKRGAGLAIELSSPVIRQYGDQLRKVIGDTLAENGVSDALVHANDKGALDCTVRARVLAAVSRATAKEAAK